MKLTDFIGLIHPAIAILFVFPLIGMVVNFAFSTHQRRLQRKAGVKSKINLFVGTEHIKLRNWLTSAIVELTLLGLSYPIGKNIIINQVINKAPFQIIFICLIFVATIASLVLLYRDNTKIWRGVFATLTGAGLVILSKMESFVVTMSGIDHITTLV
jgi:hypothetical protein